MIFAYLKWVLAHVTLETRKSHNLLSLNWKTRKASGIVQLEAESLRIRE
jgi:hypothetical protein